MKRKQLEKEIILFRKVTACHLSQTQPVTFGRHSGNCPTTRNLNRHAKIRIFFYRVTIPELREKEESISVENRHRFKRSGVPATLRICVTHLDQPLTSEPYIWDVEGNKIEGETDEDGFLEEFIACNAKKAILKVGKADHQLVYSLNLGVTVPSKTIRGVKQRLHNLGYNCGPIDNTWDMQAQEATCEFQAANDLEITGELDEDTRNLLQQEYGA